MLRLVSLADNVELEIKLKDLQRTQLTGIWLEVVDPTKEELAKVSEISGIPLDFLKLPESSNVVNLRLEPDFGVINFVIVRKIFEAKEVNPLVIAFSKYFLVTVAKSEDQNVINLAKQRLDKVKVDQPSVAAFYILDEVVANHFVHLEHIEDLASRLEEEVVEKTDQTLVKRILQTKSRLTSFNKILWYERGLVFNLKKSDATYLSAKSKSLFDSTHEYLTRQIDIVETYREILSDSINAYLSTVSNKINFSIRALTLVTLYLTIITTITSFPNTVATFFGIAQFGNTNPWLIFAIIVLSILLPSLWLWRRKWLKTTFEALENHGA
ncbi:MAG TPA: magnesium transporter CorA family protein [Candidatus Bathyarchaeia archaeon]|nr:magnesium transporter CorA family protein [Candidatus Bathyarchaeia archaeon]